MSQRRKPQSAPERQSRLLRYGQTIKQAIKHNAHPIRNTCISHLLTSAHICHLSSFFRQARTPRSEGFRDPPNTANIHVHLRTQVRRRESRITPLHRSRLIRSSNPLLRSTLDNRNVYSATRLAVNVRYKRGMPQALRHPLDCKRDTFFICCVIPIPPSLSTPSRHVTDTLDSDREPSVVPTTLARIRYLQMTRPLACRTPSDRSVLALWPLYCTPGKASREQGPGQMSVRIVFKISLVSLYNSHLSGCSHLGTFQSWYRRAI